MDIGLTWHLPSYNVHWLCRILVYLSYKGVYYMQSIIVIFVGHYSSAYMLFCERMSASVHQERPELNSKEMMYEIGRRWSALSKDEQEGYKRELVEVGGPADRFLHLRGSFLTTGWKSVAVVLWFQLWSSNLINSVCWSLFKRYWKYHLQMLKSRSLSVRLLIFGFVCSLKFWAT